MKNELYKPDYLSLMYDVRDKYYKFYCMQGKARPSFGLLLEGQCILRSRGTEVHINEDELMMIPKNCRYSSEWIGKERVVLYGFEFNFEEAPINDVSYALQNVKGCDKRLVREMFDRMYTHQGEKDGILLLESDFLAFLHYIKPFLAVNDSTASETAMNAVGKGFDYIKKHFAESFPIKEAASCCGLSESRFYRVFKLATGLTPVEYRTALRVRCAAALLERGDMSVEEICGRSGFSSAAYFREAFKAHTGMNPGEYARRKTRGL